MPSDTNPDGDIFGGFIVSMGDLAALAVAKRRCKGRAVTVKMDAMTFSQPVKVGDELVIYADLIETGRSSMKIKVCWYKMTAMIEEEIKVCEAIFTFVHVDENGKSKQLPEIEQ
jgi:acyl-CoA thioesterase YciA